MSKRCLWRMKVHGGDLSFCNSKTHGTYCSTHNIGYELDLNELEMLRVMYAKAPTNQLARKIMAEKSFIARNARSSSEVRRAEIREKEYQTTITEVKQLEEKLRYQPDYILNEIKRTINSSFDAIEYNVLTMSKRKKLHIGSDGTTFYTIDGRCFRIAIEEV